MGYAAHFPDRALTWSEGESDERRFRLILLGMLALFLAGSIVVPLIPASRPNPDEVRELPPRLARLVVREPPPKAEPEAPKPVELPPEPEPAPEPKPKPKPKPEPAPEPAPEPESRSEPPSRSQSEAREKARRSGLVALSAQLAELRNNEVVERLAQPRRLVRAAPRPQPADDGGSTDIAAGSGGIDEETLSRETGDVELAEREVTRVENPETAPAARAAAGQPQVAGRTETLKTPRSIEEIQPVFDRNKGALDVLYRRALRSNPALAGKVVLRLTIAPSGEVTACEIVSSELNAPALERKLIARVRLFDFGARADAAETTTTYPIDFFPFFPG